jgi:hypothetical protein
LKLLQSCQFFFQFFNGGLVSICLALGSIASGSTVRAEKWRPVERFVLIFGLATGSCVLPKEVIIIPQKGGSHNQKQSGCNVSSEDGLSWKVSCSWAQDAVARLLQYKEKFLCLSLDSVPFSSVLQSVG